MIALGVRPLVSFFVAHCNRPLDSLAVLPVVNSTSFLFVCFGVSFQEVALAIMGDRFEQIRPVRQFAITLTIFLTTANIIVAFSPLAAGWFITVANLPPDLMQFALMPFRIVIFLPALAVAQSVQRAVLVNGPPERPHHLVHRFGGLGDRSGYDHLFNDFSSGWCSRGGYCAGNGAICIQSVSVSILSIADQTS